MWRSFRQVVLKSKISSPSKKFQCNYSSESSSGSKKVIVGVIAAVGAGSAGAIAYGKYDPEFRKTLEKNVPYIEYIYKWLPDGEQKQSSSSKSQAENKIKEAAIASGLIKKKFDAEKPSPIEPKKSLEERKLKDTSSTQDKKIIENDNVKILDTKPVEQSIILPEKEASEPAYKKIIENDNVKILDTKPVEQSIILPEKEASEPAFNEKFLSDLIKKMQSSSEEALTAYEAAVETVRQHTKALYEALDVPEGSDKDIVWKDVTKASVDKNNAINMAKKKTETTKILVEKLKLNLRKAAQVDANSPVVKSGEDSIEKVLQQLKKAEAEVTSVETEASTAAEYQKLVNSSKEQFRKELQIVLPNYIHGVKDKTMTESDLNLLIAHAHRRIEQLQKQLAKQQVTEKMRIDEAVRQQKTKHDDITDTRIEAELERRNLDLETAVSNRVASLKENFEVELRQQLRRQAAAHADHIQEVLKVQEQELSRKYSLDLEEKLLHQKGVFISEVSGNMARLKGILAFLKAKSEFDTASKKAQTLWLACQSMSQKISEDKSGNPSPLGKDIAAVKIAADEDNEFVNSVLAAIPVEAVSRGVYTTEVLKQRFCGVKKVCQKVALIDENNDSLYRYVLSYLQSLFIIDAVSIPKAELEGKVAVDTSEWDTYDILCRVSYSLKVDNLEQALRYANQLRGEPRVVAKDWIKELRLLLETQLAVKALLAHAAAVGVQAYH